MMENYALIENDLVVQVAVADEAATELLASIGGEWVSCRDVGIGYSYDRISGTFNVTPTPISNLDRQGGI